MIVAAEDYILLDGKRVPGIFVGLEIRQQVRFKETEVVGLSGASKRPDGFSDAEIQIELLVSGDNQHDVWENVQRINDMFSGTTSKAKPKIYRLTTPHAKARRIDRVLFKELRTRETNDTDVVNATLTFIQHRPVQRKKEDKAPESGPGDLQRYVEYKSKDYLDETNITGGMSIESPIKDET